MLSWLKEKLKTGNLIKEDKMPIIGQRVHLYEEQWKVIVEIRDLLKEIRDLLVESQKGK